MSEIKKWAKCTVSDLKDELASRGLATNGRKSELLQRLMAHEKDLSSATTVTVGDGEETFVDEDVDVDVDQVNEEDEIDAVIQDVMEEDNAEAKKEDEEVETQSKADSLAVNADHDIAPLGDLDESKISDFSDLKGDAAEEDKIDQEEKTIEQEEKMDDQEEKMDQEDSIVIEAEVSDEFKPDEEEDKDSKPKENGEEEKKAKREKEYYPLPAMPMNNWLVKKYANAKRYSSLIIKPLDSSNILGEAIVEWGNRSVYFCINHERDGMGAAILNFITEKECREAKDALSAALGEEVKVMHLSRQMETEMQDFAYKFECPNLAQRTLIIEECPEDVSEDQVCVLFPGAISVSRPEVNSQLHSWQKVDYELPQNISKIVFVEFGSKALAEKAVEGKEGYEIDGHKLKVGTMYKYVSNYRQWIGKQEEERRKKRREEKEKRRKEEEKKALTRVYGDKERIEMCRQLRNITSRRNGLQRRQDIPWNQKLMEVEGLSKQILDTVRKLDFDTDKRVKMEKGFPENENLMTKHTRQLYYLQKKKSRENKEKEKENLKITVSSDAKREVEKKEGDEAIVIKEESAGEEEADADEAKDQDEEMEEFDGSCQLCDFMCDTNEELKEHKKDEHGPEGKCPHGCEFVFPWNHMERYESHHNEFHSEVEYVKPEPPPEIEKKNKEKKDKGSKKEKDRSRKYEDPNDPKDFQKEMKKLEADNRGWYSMSINKVAELNNKKQGEEHFSKFGTVMEVHFTKTRIFVRFGSRKAVYEAIKKYWGDEKWKPEVADILAKYKAGGGRKRVRSRSRSRDRRVSPRRMRRDTDRRQDRSGHRGGGMRGDRGGGRRGDIPSLLNSVPINPNINNQLQQANQMIMQQQQLQQQAMMQQAMLQQQQMQQMQGMGGRPGIMGANPQMGMLGSGAVPSLLGGGMNDNMSDRRRDNSGDRGYGGQRNRRSRFDSDNDRGTSGDGDVATVLKGLTQVLSSKMEQLTRLSGGGEGSMTDVLDTVGGMSQHSSTPMAGGDRGGFEFNQGSPGMGSYNNQQANIDAFRAGMPLQQSDNRGPRSLLGAAPGGGNSAQSPVYAGPNSSHSRQRRY